MKSHEAGALGIHPDTSALTRVLADAGVDGPWGPLSEAMVLGVGGGLGAGYILWEFSSETDHKGFGAGTDRRAVTTGFRNRWQYPDRWVDSVLNRLGVGFRREQTGSSRKAARQLDQTVDEGGSAVVDVSVADLPYWHLPPEEAGRWGYPIAVTGREPDRYLVDDRADGRLTVPHEALERARGRIASYKNRLVVLERSESPLDEEEIAEAIEAGLIDAVEHLASSSESFSLPAFRKWARMITSTASKGWRSVFADGQGLWSALRSTHEAVSEVGILGGTLRPLYAGFLDEAVPVLGRSELLDAAESYRGAARAWEDVAEATNPPGFEPLRAAAKFARRRREAVRRGDAGEIEAAEAAAALNALGTEFDSGLPLTDGEIDDLLQRLSAAVEAAYEAEVEAHAALSSMTDRSLA